MALFPRELTRLVFLRRNLLSKVEFPIDELGKPNVTVSVPHPAFSKLKKRKHTVNDLINVHTQIDASYLINDPSTCKVGIRSSPLINVLCHPPPPPPQENVISRSLPPRSSKRPTMPTQMTMETSISSYERHI